jgi:hypothetical protein
VRSWISSESVDFVDASHDAYASLSDPVRHRRRVLFAKPRFFVVVDDLAGREDHDVELRFQFAAGHLDRHPPEWVVRRGRSGHGLWVGVFSSGACAIRVCEGQTDPPEGWVSPNYGTRQAAPIVIYAKRARLPVRFVTLLLPAARVGATPPEVSIASDDAGRISRVWLKQFNELVRVDDNEVVIEPTAPESWRAD